MTRDETTRELATDICVVGAGPAGLTLALLLLKSGVAVTVVERSRAHQREFRGEILQPGAMALLDQLGVLAGARARGAHEHARFRLVERDRVLLDIDYRGLPAPHNHLLSIPQAHVLDELLLHCEKFEGFRYLEGTRVNGLLREQERIVGVTADGSAGHHTVRAHCVVAAGRAVVQAHPAGGRVRRGARAGAGRPGVPGRGQPGAGLRVLAEPGPGRLDPSARRLQGGGGGRS
jgi:monooxygenase